MASMSVAAQAVTFTSRSPLAILEAFGRPGLGLSGGILERIAGAAGFQPLGVCSQAPACGGGFASNLLHLSVPVSLAGPSSALLPGAASSYGKGSALRVFNMLCGGVSAGLIMFNASQPQTIPPPDDVEDEEELGSEHGDREGNGEDPQKVLVRLVKKILARVNKIPVQESKEAVWYLKRLENLLGPDAASCVVKCSLIVKEKCNTLYLLVLTGLSCFSLEINVFQGFRIVRQVLAEQRDEVHSRLEAYDRAVKRKPGEQGEAEAIVAFSVFNLTTKQVQQIVLLIDGQNLHAIHDFLKENSKHQPALPKGLGEAANPALPKHQGEGAKPALPNHLREAAKTAQPKLQGEAAEPALPKLQGEAAEPAKGQGTDTK